MHQIACIKMTMPRPSGKAFKIAKETIPGMNRNDRTAKKSKREVPKDNLELKIVDINENIRSRNL